MPVNMTRASLQTLVRANPQVQVLTPTPGRVAARAATRPARGAVPTPSPALEELFQALQILATRHGWTNQYTYNADGDDAGLHITLAREVLLFAEVAATHDALSPRQQQWLAAIQATGQAEAYAWTPASLPQIRERLGRKRVAS